MENIEVYKNSKYTLLELIIDRTNKFSGTEEERNDLEKLYLELYNVIRLINKYNLSHNLHQDDYYIELLQKTTKTPLVINYDEKEYNTFKIEQKEVYTEEEALNIIQRTVNNTRKNLIKSKENSNALAKDDYTGACGFSQFSSIYPLEKMGLKVTLNNAYNFSSISHAFGTVTIPVLINNNVIDKQYLIDCTYSQFFKISESIPNDVVGISPGYYMKRDKEEFAKKVLEDGFFELNKDSIKDYWYGFYMASNNKEKYSNIDLIKKINEKNVDYDSDEEEFIEYGMNLDLNKNVNFNAHI